jgi:tripeptidyl-peptidase-1
MYLISILPGLASVFATAAALSSSKAPETSLKVFESVRGVPQGWTKVGKPDSTTRLRFQIALSMPNHALFEQTLYDISTPDHESYGQHLSHDEVRSLVQPRDEASLSVLSWLEVSGVPESDIKNAGNWILFYADLAKIEEMMNTEFFYFTQDADKSQVKRIRTLQYSVPANLKDQIAMIQPTTRFGQMKPEGSNVLKAEFFKAVNSNSEAPVVPADALALNVTACNATITPDCLRALYSIGDYQADPTCGSLFGVCGYLKEYAKYDALDAFFDKYAPYAAGVQNFSYTLINGGLDTQNDTVDDDVEANLDIQYAASIGFNDNITYYSTAGNGLLVPDLDQPSLDENQNEPVRNWKSNPDLFFSLSWGN